MQNESHLVPVLTTCPHCKLPGNGNLCSNCGENLHPKRITLLRLLKDIPDVFDLEFGLLYTIRTFLTRPGKEIRDYFAGDRQKHYKPLKFILFIAGIVTFLMISLGITQPNATPFEEFEWQWNSVLLMLQFPMIAFCTWLIFRSRKYNYGEHLVANAFLIGEVLIYHLLLIPVYLAVNGTLGVSILALLYQLWIICYYTYAFYDWFYNKKTAAGFFKSLGVVIGIYIIVMSITYVLELILYSVVKIWGLE